eukprot:3941145-Rhodomonas_salina.1
MAVIRIVSRTAKAMGVSGTQNPAWSYATFCTELAYAATRRFAMLLCIIGAADLCYAPICATTLLLLRNRGYVPTKYQYEATIWCYDRLTEAVLCPYILLHLYAPTRILNHHLASSDLRVWHYHSLVLNVTCMILRLAEAVSEEDSEGFRTVRDAAAS